MRALRCVIRLNSDAVGVSTPEKANRAISPYLRFLSEYGFSVTAQHQRLSNVDGFSMTNRLVKSNLKTLRKAILSQYIACGNAQHYAAVVYYDDFDGITIAIGDV